MSADMGPTKPEAGVIATSPATAPDAAPSTVGLPRVIHSVNIQPSAAVAAAVFVARNPLAPRPLPSRALPAVHPDQPDRGSAAPAAAMGTEPDCLGCAPCQ